MTMPKAGKAVRLRDQAANPTYNVNSKPFAVVGGEISWKKTVPSGASAFSHRVAR